MFSLSRYLKDIQRPDFGEVAADAYRELIETLDIRLPERYLVFERADRHRYLEDYWENGLALINPDRDQLRFDFPDPPFFHAAAGLRSEEGGHCFLYDFWGTVVFTAENSWGLGWFAAISTIPLGPRLSVLRQRVETRKDYHLLIYPEPELPSPIVRIESPFFFHIPKCTLKED